MKLYRNRMYVHSLKKTIIACSQQPNSSPYENCMFLTFVKSLSNNGLFTPFLIVNFVEGNPRILFRYEHHFFSVCTVHNGLMLQPKFSFCDCNARFNYDCGLASTDGLRLEELRAKNDTGKFNVNHYPLGCTMQCIWFGKRL